MSTYNLASVKEMAGGDEDFLKVVVQTFLEEIPPDVSAMEESIKEDNPKLAYQYAHKMKPNLQMFGLNLQQEIKNIEAWSNGNKKREDVQSSINNIIVTVTKASEELKRDFNL